MKQYKQGKCGCHFAVVQQTIVDDMIGLEMEEGMYCGQFGHQFNPNQIKCNRAASVIVRHEFLKPGAILLFMTKTILKT